LGNRAEETHCHRGGVLLGRFTAQLQAEFYSLRCRFVPRQSCGMPA
jgi:hypothetical protein